MALDALNTASAGLRSLQASIGIVSQNVANAGTAGYVRRTLTTVSQGEGNSGVATGNVTRIFDTAALNQLRLETAGAGYTATKADILGQVDKLYGVPGTASALDGVVNTFTQSLQVLSADPTSVAARASVTDAAGRLAEKLNGLSDGVQSLRTGIEAQLGTDVKQASGLLSEVASLNVKISSTPDSGTRADLEDQRDQRINQLSGLMDIRTVQERDGTVGVLTSSGITLVERGSAATLSFDGRGTLSAEAGYSLDPTKRGVGTIVANLPGGAKIDLGEPGSLRSGSIAAQFELRDQILPQAQRQLDDLAAGMSSALSDRTATGTQVAGGYQLDLAGIQSGNSVTIPVQVGGVTRNVILVGKSGASQAGDPSVTIDPSAYVQTFSLPTNDLAGSLNDAMTKLSQRLGSGAPALTATAGSPATTVTIGAGAGTTVNGARANVTVAASAGGPFTGANQLPLFVDGGDNSLYTGSVEVGAQLTGFAQRIAVNPSVARNTASLVVSTAGGSPDAARANALYDSLTSTKVTFSAASGIGGLAAPYTSSVVGFAQDVIGAQSAAAASARSMNEGQSVALSTAQARFSDQAGVNIDDELSKLIALQSAYTANARVLTAARDMLDTLLRI